MEEKSVILFDGVCNLCNDAVNFVIDHDRNNHFQFASLQSDFGKSILEKYLLQNLNLDTFVLIENNKAYLKSTAALRVCKRLGFPFLIAFPFIIVPKFIRDGIYNWVAKNRYQWFGKSATCRIPTPELRNKFLG